MELLAELKDFPAFVLLVQILKGYEAEVLAEIAVIKTESELVRSTRFYQNLRNIRQVIENKPQEAATALEEIKLTALHDPEAGGPVDVYQRRFSFQNFDEQMVQGV